MSDAEQSVTGWFHALKNGDDSAAQNLWNRYFRRLTGFARKQLEHSVAYDEEDLAVSVFDALCRATRDGRYDQVADREDLWRLLVTIANRKAIDRYRHRRTKGRTPDRPIAADVDLDREIPARDDVPAWQVAMEEQCRHLINVLDEGQMQQIALLKLEEHTNQQIADQLQISERTVRRTIHLIRHIWRRELEEQTD